MIARLNRVTHHLNPHEFTWAVIAAICSHVAAATLFQMFSYFAQARRIHWNTFDSLLVAISLAGFFTAKGQFKRISWRLASLGLLGLIALQWVALFLHLLWEHVTEHHGIVSARQPLSAAVALIVLIGIYVYFQWTAQADLAVISQREAGFRRGLILFLSTPKVEDLPFLTSVTGDILDPNVWESFDKRNWRMPVESIAHVMRQGALSTPPATLQQILVITSQKSRIPGSCEYFAIFEQMLNRLCAGRPAAPKVVQLADEGVNFDDFRALSLAVQAAKQRLRAAQIDDIYVDVTGGTAVCSVVGAGLSFEHGDQFIYVDTTSHEVRAYDIQYEPPQKVVEG